uniref:Uncharacterized protein n=1 Tax=Cucumis melo TaxID=3656 RepID=A0A9I9DZQ3_CUCME
MEDFYEGTRWRIEGSAKQTNEGGEGTHGLVGSFKWRLKRLRDRENLQVHVAGVFARERESRRAKLNRRAFSRERDGGGTKL